MVPLERWQARNAPHAWRPLEGWHHRAARARGGPGGPEARLERVRRGFRGVSRRIEGAARLRRLGRRGEKVVVAVAAALSAYVSWVNLSPWPPLTVLRHLVASKSCRGAWEMGLTPARRGEPGYWPVHDRRSDGVSCEEWTERRRAAGLYPFDGSDGPGRPWRDHGDGYQWYYPYPNE